MTDHQTREYPHAPVIGIGLVVLRPDAVLLVRRGRPPDQGRWSIPGGGQELGETAEQAARRELLEETGLTVDALLLLTHVDSIHRDPAGRVQFHYTILDFAAAWRGGEPVAGDDVTAAAFVAFDALTGFDLSSEAHRVIALARATLHGA